MSINRRERGIGPLWIIGTATVGLAALVTAAIPALRHLRETPPPPPPSLHLVLPDEAIGAAADYPFGLAVAPDGRRVAFPAASDGRVTLWLRDLTTGEARALPTIDGAAMPFWSTDGAKLAYFAGGRLHVFDVAGEADSELADAPTPRGGTWLPSGDMLLAPAIDGGLVRYRTSAQTLEPFTELDTASGELSHGMPTVSPDGQYVIFHVRATTAARGGVWWAPIDRPADRRRLVGSDAHGIVSAGHLLFANDTALMAQRIDLDGGALLGRPMMLATPVGRGPLGQLFVAVAEQGPLFYAPPMSTLRTLAWLDRSGMAIGEVGAPATSWDVRVAPTGDRVAVTQVDTQLGTLDVWAYDGSRPLPIRISAAIETDDQAVWSPDASRLAWVRGRRSIIVRGAQAVLPEETIRRFDGPVRLWDWSADARWLIVGLTDPATRDDLWILSARGDEDPRPLIRSPFSEHDAAVSPDGRWIAFASDESGRDDIYVDTFPLPGHRSRLTLGGGSTPRWRRDGREIYFRRGREIHTITVAPEAQSLAAIATTKLFDATGEVRSYDVTSDGTRFLVNLPAAATAPPVQVIVNWQTVLATPP
jgi:Tol biopolymer transport system component